MLLVKQAPFWETVASLGRRARAQSREYWTWEEWDEFFEAADRSKESPSMLYVWRGILAVRQRAKKAREAGLTAWQFAQQERHVAVAFAQREYEMKERQKREEQHAKELALKRHYEQKREEYLIQFRAREEAFQIVKRERQRRERISYEDEVDELR